MTSLPSSTRASTVDRVSVPAPGADPESFLSAFRGGPRGFWGRGDRWVAWAGTLEEVQVQGESLGAAVERVREHLSSFLGGDGREAESASRVRIFGGFHFGSDQEEGVGHWAGFPAARFILPEVLLEQGPDAPRLTLQRLEKEGGGGPDGDGADGEEVAGGSPAGAADGPGGLRIADLLARIQDAEGMGRGPTPSVSSSPSPNGAGAGAPGGAREAWAAAVARILEEISAGRLEKVVLARILDVELPEPFSIPGLLDRLRRENVRSHVFLFEPEPGRALVGAAPEVLAELREGRFHASAVAGSIARGGSPSADAALAARLLASRKDLAEHRHTVEVMREGLLPLLRELEVGDRPQVLTLERIQHLETRFDGVVGDGVDILELVQVLHPTPAVCGRPREEALRLIGEVEPFQRGWYAGPVGWVDTRGDGDFVPALRSAVGHGRRWRLFAGAGIVDGSEADAEWEETGLKFEPVLRGLDVPGF